MRINKTHTKFIVILLIMAMTFTQSTIVFAEEGSGGPVQALMTVTASLETDFNINAAGTITGYTGTDTVVEIPATIGGIPATSIGNEAFRDNVTLSSITIPSGVISIGANAFNGCAALSSVTLPDGLTTINNYAFRNCPQLAFFHIPSSVTFIGGNVFLNTAMVNNSSGVLYIDNWAVYCRTSIPGGTSFTFPNGTVGVASSVFYNVSPTWTTIGIPASVRFICDSAFSGCNELTQITVDASNTEFCSVDGVLYDKNQTTIVRYPIAKTETAYTVPSSITAIRPLVFYPCDTLKTITFLGNMPPTFFSTSLSGMAENLEIFVPYSVLPAYQTALVGKSLPTGYTLSGTPGTESTFGYIATLFSNIVMANGTAKTATALGLPSEVALATDKGIVQSTITWDVGGTTYNPAITTEQNFMVEGSVTLPSGVINPNNVSLTASINVTVNAVVVINKTLVSITTPTAITGVTNGSAKTASELGLPSEVSLATDNGNVQATVAWNVDGSAYNPSVTTAQTFTVDGSVTLPSGVINPNNVSLTTSTNVTVNAAAVLDKTFLAIAPIAPITGVANGTAKTASAFGLPSEVTLVTDNGNVQAIVAWDVDGCSYDSAVTTVQTFVVDGSVTLPSGVINPNNVSLTTSINVTVNMAAVLDKTFVAIAPISPITGVANGTAKTAPALGLPSEVTLATDNGNVQATVAWDVDGSSYNPTVITEQSFTVTGSITLPSGVINPGNISLTVNINVTVNAATVLEKTLVSITAPVAIIGAVNGSAKTASALGLPSEVTLVTDNGNVQATVTWDVDGSSYNPSATTEQPFTVDGNVMLPSGIINPGNVSLITSINVTVNAAAVLDKTLVSIATPAAITGLANGTAKTTSALGLPTKVILVTDNGNVQAIVAWDVDSSSYNPTVTAEQTFRVDGSVTLPSGVINPDSVSLTASINVTVNAAASTDKILVSIAAPNAITGIANGAAKTAAGLGLPSTVNLVTNNGTVSANVTWDVALSSYNQLSGNAQTFIVNGIITIPSGVVNTNNVNLATTISVSVKIADSSSGGSGSGGSLGGDNSTSGGSVTPTITPDKKPNQPIIAETVVTATAGNNGLAIASISESAVADAIAKAQAEASSQNGIENGIGITIRVDSPSTASSLGITLTEATLQRMISAQVRSFEVDGRQISLDFNLQALQEIQRQSTGNVTITITPSQNLSTQASTLIGTRPVYNIIISYIRNGQTVSITSMKQGAVSLSLPYNLVKGEYSSNLYAAYVDGKGKITLIQNSSYDAGSDSILFSTDHFSVYGVAYQLSPAKLTDITKHWAKESIDYVFGRGIMNGTAENIFSPDLAMNRGMLTVALCKLMGADVSSYTTSSFTDVNADNYYLPYIEWVYKKGIMGGIGINQFAPDKAVTREEIAGILTNYAKATGYTLPIARESIVFTDVSNISSWAKDSVTAMQQAGIMAGKTNNKFNPQASATRAEVAAALHRYVKLTIATATAQGWALNDDGQRCYYKDGIMVSGKWLVIDKKWYYFYTDGSLAVNTKINGYEIDKNGARITK